MQVSPSFARCCLAASSFGQHYQSDDGGGKRLDRGIWTDGRPDYPGRHESPGRQRNNQPTTLSEPTRSSLHWRFFSLPSALKAGSSHWATPVF